MSADFNLHVARNENEEYHASNYKRTTFWSSENPFSHMETPENLDYIANWSRGYSEKLINGKWTKDDIVYSMDDEEFDKIDWATTKQRDIYLYVDEDIVFNTDQIYVCDTYTKNVPDLMYERKLTTIDEALIKDVVKVADDKKAVENFMRKNLGKKCFVIAH